MEQLMETINEIVYEFSQTKDKQEQQKCLELIKENIENFEYGRLQELQRKRNEMNRKISALKKEALAKN